MGTARASLVVVDSLWGIGANLAGPGYLKAASPSWDALHEVMSGNNLHLIAGYYYGDARQWERIWQANRHQIPTPNRVERGSLPRIPAAVSPEESYTDFLARVRRVLTSPGPAGSEASNTPEVRNSGETPPAPAGPRRERATPPGSGGSAGPPRAPGANRP